MQGCAMRKVRHVAHACMLPWPQESLQHSMLFEDGVPRKHPSLPHPTGQQPEAGKAPQVRVICRGAHTHAYTHKHTLALAQTHTRTHPHQLTLLRARTHTLLMHTQARKHKHTLAHS